MRGRSWRAFFRHFAADLNLRAWAVVMLMALWLWLNMFDLLVTYEGLAADSAYEANRFMSAVIQKPVLAVFIKMSLAYLLLKLVERLETRTPYSGLAPLLGVNIYLSWACLHNLHIVSGTEDWSCFLRYYPLVGPPW